ncbi:MAG: phospholipase D-like domain-containing protein [Ktedonobacteraceae bacterium]
MNDTSLMLRRGSYILTSFVVLILCALLLGCDVNISPTGGNFCSISAGCQGNCTTGPGVQGVQVFVEPDAKEQPILDAIAGAKKSVWLEIYLLSDRNVIRGLEEAANRGIDVRVMLEPHPFGGGGSPARTMDELQAAGAKVEDSNPGFALTHEKGIPIV